MWLGTDVETMTARAEDGGARVKAKEGQWGRFRPKPGAPGRFGSRARRVAGREAPPTHERRHGKKQRRKRDGDGGDGSFLNISKFHSPIYKLSFSPSSWP